MTRDIHVIKVRQQVTASNYESKLGVTITEKLR